MTPVAMTAAARAAVMTSPRSKLRHRRWLAPASLAALAGLQVVCGLFFVQNIVVSVFGLRTTPVSWSWHEALEIMATVGLLLGTALGGIVIRMLVLQRRRDAEHLRVAAGEFYEVVQDQFRAWSFTPSERDVAMFMLKGLSNQEIASLRSTSEGTIKSQTTAIFRKSGASGRAQFLSLFVEELLAKAERDESAGRGSCKSA